MHSMHGKKHSYHYNGDYSGDIKIVDEETGSECNVPFDELKALVAGYIRMERISHLENASADEILGVHEESRGE